MISAMPAVAVRNARRPLNIFRVRKSGSYSSSISSLNLSRPKRAARHRLRYSGASNDRDLLIKRVLIYSGTLFLIAGLLLVFIGVGANVTTAKTVGLILIGLGTTLCIMKVFYSEAQMTKIITKVPIYDPEDSTDNHAVVPKTVSSSQIIPVIEVTEFTALPVSPPDNQNSAETIKNNYKQINNRVTTSCMTETQVLIPESSEKYCITNM